MLTNVVGRIITDVETNGEGLTYLRQYPYEMEREVYLKGRSDKGKPRGHSSLDTEGGKRGEGMERSKVVVKYSLGLGSKVT